MMTAFTARTRHVRAAAMLLLILSGDTGNGAGQTWSIQMQDSSIVLLDVCFTDDRTGWAVGTDLLNGIIFHTQDGGEIWTKQGQYELESYRNSRLVTVLNGVSFIDENTGWVVGAGLFTGEGIILHTVNGGDTWDIQENNTIENKLAVHFVNDRTGFAVGWTGVVALTADSGNTWVEQFVHQNPIIKDVDFVGDRIGWIAGLWGFLLRTDDAGANWSLLSNDLSPYLGATGHIEGVDFINEQSGWAVGAGTGTFFGEYDGGFIIKTTDGGDTWSVQDSSFARHYRKVHAANEEMVWAVGNTIPLQNEQSRGAIMSTEDGGLTWSEQIFDNTERLWSIHFTDAQTGWAVGDQGIILHYSNITQFNAPSVKVISDAVRTVGVKFDDRTTLSLHIRSDNLNGAEVSVTGYSDFAPSDIPKDRWLRDVIGYYRLASDMMQSFTGQLTVQYTEELLSVTGIDEEDLTFVYWDTALKNWVKTATVVDRTQHTASTAITRFEIWALTTRIDELLTDLESLSGSGDVTTFHLHSNYPNPFNPATTIQYQLPVRSHIELRIYNLRGQEIRQLVREYIQPGLYSVEWDGTDESGLRVPSGIYFCRMQAGSFTQTRKLILLK